ncbi:hypothetical protein [Mesorhizobium sp. M0800]|uniref:hypothetical protein n=1 Tax=Mesorhizobium sp. M0800 TaxID=2957000 RepID=UPI00333935C7
MAVINEIRREDDAGHSYIIRGCEEEGGVRRLSLQPGHESPYSGGIDLVPPDAVMLRRAGDDDTIDDARISLALSAFTAAQNASARQGRLAWKPNI